jgi:hypothetical protein
MPATSAMLAFLQLCAIRHWPRSRSEARLVPPEPCVACRGQRQFRTTDGLVEHLVTYHRTNALRELDFMVLIERLEREPEAAEVKP